MGQGDFPRLEKKGGDIPLFCKKKVSETYSRFRLRALSLLLPRCPSLLFLDDRPVGEGERAEAGGEGRNGGEVEDRGWQGAIRRWGERKDMFFYALLFPFQSFNLYTFAISNLVLKCSFWSILISVFDGTRAAVGIFPSDRRLHGGGGGGGGGAPRLDQEIEEEEGGRRDGEDDRSSGHRRRLASR